MADQGKRQPQGAAGCDSIKFDQKLHEIEKNVVDSGPGSANVCTENDYLLFGGSDIRTIFVVFLIFSTISKEEILSELSEV